MKTKFNLMDKRKEFMKNMDYALGKFDWGNSCLDAEAIQILNEWKIKLIEQDKEFIRLLTEKLKESEEMFKKALDKPCFQWSIFEELGKLTGENKK